MPSAHVETYFSDGGRRVIPPQPLPIVKALLHLCVILVSY